VTYRLKNGGGVVESVIIPSNTPDGRTTVCVSSQLGCAMNCQFCFTAKMGLRRNLSTAQIVEQVVNARRLTGGGLRPPAAAAATAGADATATDATAGAASRGFHGTREEVTNVVFMGMGEPLHNIEAVLAAVVGLYKLNSVDA
jgi:23S rRNA (adenine2503-C2)-methyltransferase